MKIFSGYVREQKRYTKNELKHIFSFDEAGVEKFIKSLKAYGVLKSVKNSNAQLFREQSASGQRKKQTTLLLVSAHSSGLHTDFHQLNQIASG